MSKREPQNFEKMNLSVGSRLTFPDLPNIEVIIASASTVKWEGKEYSLTKIAQVLQKQYGCKNPRHHWLIDGKPLTAIYDETYGPKLQEQCPEGYWSGIWAYHTVRTTHRVWPRLNQKGLLTITLNGNKKEDQIEITPSKFLVSLASDEFSKGGTIRMGSLQEKTLSLRSIRDQIQQGHCTKEVSKAWHQSAISIELDALAAHTGTLPPAKGVPEEKENLPGPGYIYALRLPKIDEYVKIGYTGDLGKRLSAFQVGFPEEIEFSISKQTNYPQEAERLIHSRLENHVRGEWFKLANDEDIEELISRCTAAVDQVAQKPKTDPSCT